MSTNFHKYAKELTRPCTYFQLEGYPYKTP